MVHFVPFVKGVVPFLKGDGQLVKGADRLKLLSKLAVFPLLLIIGKSVQRKPFSWEKRENGPKTGGMGKRENEIECREKGKGRAPDLKSEPRITSRREGRP